MKYLMVFSILIIAMVSISYIYPECKKLAIKINPNTVECKQELIDEVDSRNSEGLQVRLIGATILMIPLTLLFIFLYKADAWNTPNWVWGILGLIFLFVVINDIIKIINFTLIKNLCE